MPKQMHLAQFLLHGPTYHSLAMWRHPLTDSRYDWARPELYQHIAQVCERGKFDMVFFADFVLTFYNYRHSIDPAIRYGVQTPVHDPVPLLSWMAAVTSQIGLAATFSVGQQHPFYVARLFSTLDHRRRLSMRLYRCCKSAGACVRNMRVTPCVSICGKVPPPLGEAHRSRLVYDEHVFRRVRHSRTLHGDGLGRRYRVVSQLDTSDRGAYAASVIVNWAGNKW